MGSVIAGVGVRNYYRRLGYKLRGDGQYLIKDLMPCPASERDKDPKSFEASFIEAAIRVQARDTWLTPRVARAATWATAGLAAMVVISLAVHRRWYQKNR